MTNPTNDDHNDGMRLRLHLDSGELLELDGSTATADPAHPRATVVLRMTPWRAHDLAHVLDTYTQLAAIMTDAMEVSGTEESLSRALFDAAELLRPPAQRSDAGLGKVTSGRRLQAMAVLQEHRPDLDHSALIAAVDAAALWADESQDYLVTSLFAAVAGEEAAGAAYAVLIGIDDRRPSTDGLSGGS